MDPSKTPNRVGRPKLSETRGKMSTRERILETAAELFVQRGYASVSINEITELVRVTKPTLYHYFGDKENLYAAVLKQLISEGGDKLEALLSEEMQYRKQLHKLAWVYIQEHADCCVGFMVKDAVSNLKETMVAELRHELENRIVKQLSWVFAQGIASGEVRPEDPQVLAWMALSTLDCLSFQSQYLSVTDPERLVRSFVEQFSLPVPSENSPDNMPSA